MGWYMGDWAGWGPGWGGWHAVGHLLWWALLVVGIVAVLRWARSQDAPPPSTGTDRALDVLRERYARGEIDREEYEERRHVLGP